MTNGGNVRRGHAYEREVKQHFVDAGWGCTRAACSKSAMDLIAFHQYGVPLLIDLTDFVFIHSGYTITHSGSRTIPLHYLASKIEKRYIKHVYYDVIWDHHWCVVLMQCKIRRR